MKNIDEQVLINKNMIIKKEATLNNSNSLNLGDKGKPQHINLSSSQKLCIPKTCFNY